MKDLIDTLNILLLLMFGMLVGFAIVEQWPTWIPLFRIVFWLCLGLRLGIVAVYLWLARRHPEVCRP